MEKGKLIEVMGDVTTPQRVEEHETVFLPHVCNDIGAFGAGVALAIARKWGPARDVYVNYIGQIGIGSHHLGSTVYWDSWYKDNIMTPENKDNVIVCHMIAQHELVGPDNPRPLNYGALTKCMTDVERTIRESYLDKNRVARIHCPMFGSERAGASWEIILELIEFLWLNNGIDVIVYKYVK